VALSGTFATMPFPDLMQWLGDARRTGVLTVILDFEERFLRLQDGMLVGLGSDDPRARDLARLLLARGLIDEPRLRRALAAQDQSRRPLRVVLTDDGYVPAAAVFSAVRSHAKDIAMQLFLWHDGRFSFNEAGPALLAEPQDVDGFLIDPPIPMRELLMDGLRRLDEWRRIAEVLPSDYTVIHALGRATDLPALEMLADIGDPVALGDLCMRIGRPRFEVIEELYEAWRRGILAIDAVPQQLSIGMHTSHIDVLVSTAQTLLEEQQFDEAAALLRSALDLDPYHDHARQLLNGARLEQLASLYVQFPPFKVVVPEKTLEATQGLNLTPRERYLMTRIDGLRDVGTLTVMTPLGELETLRALRKFHHIGLVSLR
jgi:hypothetical protein